jgi:hypothetical protein
LTREPWGSPRINCLVVPDFTMFCVIIWAKNRVTTLVANHNFVHCLEMKGVKMGVLGGLGVLGGMGGLGKMGRMGVLGVLGRMGVLGVLRVLASPGQNVGLGWPNLLESPSQKLVLG